MRLIPNLLINNGKLIKNRSFKKYKYLGDPVNTAKIYFEKGADELFLVDNSAFKNNINIKLIEEIVNNCFIPITYAGSISSIEDIKMLVSAGIERVAIGVYEEKDWDKIIKCTNFLGKSGVCPIFNIRWNRILNRNMIFDYKKNRCKYRYSMDKLIDDANSLSIGEIIIFDTHSEGCRTGFSLYELRNKINRQTSLIAAGGIKDYDECKLLWSKGFSGVCCSTLLSLILPHDAVLINYPKEHVKKFLNDISNSENYFKIN